MVSHVEFMLSVSSPATEQLVVEIDLISNSTIMFIYRLPVPVCESEWFFKIWLGSPVEML